MFRMGILHARPFNRHNFAHLSAHYFGFHVEDLSYWVSRREADQYVRLPHHHFLLTSVILMLPCRYSAIPSQPNVTAINQYGSFHVAHSRLAFIDGSDDPWLYATPHSTLSSSGGIRRDTISQPFKMIKGVGYPLSLSKLATLT